ATLVIANGQPSAEGRDLVRIEGCDRGVVEISISDITPVIARPSSPAGIIVNPGVARTLKMSFPHERLDIAIAKRGGGDQRIIGSGDKHDLKPVQPGLSALEIGGRFGSFTFIR